MYKLIPILLFINAPLIAGWLERKAEGWAWYEEPNELTLEEPQAATSTEQLELIKKNLDALFAEALLNPTPENLIRYMETQKEWIGKSAEFSSSWGKILLTRPDLDPTATNYATTHYGRRLQKAIEQEERERVIQNVAKQYGIFFFYEGESKSSKAFAHVVTTFTEKYHCTIIGISMDGVTITGINNDAGPELAKKLGINVFPALLAYAPGTQTIIPLAFGLKSLDQIENNVFVQFKERE